MFVKNVVEVADATINVGVIFHTGSTSNQVFTGTVKNIPEYFLNEQVIRLEISLGQLFIHIGSIST